MGTTYEEALERCVYTCPKHGGRFAAEHCEKRKIRERRRSTLLDCQHCEGPVLIGNIPVRAIHVVHAFQDVAPPLPKPIHHCLDCGTTDPADFKAGRYSRCMVCQREKNRMKAQRQRDNRKVKVLAKKTPRKILTKGQHLCKVCGETDPKRFHASSHNMCKACKSAHDKARRIPVARKLKPYLCLECGETDPNKFPANKVKSRCNECNNRFRARRYAELHGKPKNGG